MTYDQAFYDAQRDGSYESAQYILPDVLYLTGAKKVVDVGCGVGTWLAIAKRHGVDLVVGVDGHDPDIPMMIGTEDYYQRDLENGFDCSGCDLAICMEVAEHLSLEAAPKLVEGLCQARWVLFSAAHPGQGGVNHINEQWGTWWAAWFEQHGYVSTADLKWLNWDNRSVNDFYRENVLLFAKREDFIGRKLRIGAIDVIHPQRLGTW